MSEVHTGRCLCGAVRFEAKGSAKWTGYRHCESCRRHTAAPVAAFAGFEEDQVSFTTARPGRIASSPGVLRGFCAHCGSTLTYKGDRWPTEIHIHMGAFDAPESVPPQGHAFPEERLAWLHIEGLPPQA